MPLPLAAPTAAPLLQFAGRGIQAAGALAIIKDLLGPAIGAVQSAAASPSQALQSGNTTAGKYTVSPSQEASIYQAELYQDAIRKLLEGVGLAEPGGGYNARELIDGARERNQAALRETRSGEIALGELGVMEATNPAIAQGAASTVTSADDLLGQVIDSILTNARVSGDAAVGQVI